MKKRIDYIIKHNRIVQYIYKIVASLLLRLIGIFIRIDDRLVLFNAHGRKYNDSPKAIFLYMVNNPKYKDYKLVWALDEPDAYDIPGCDKVKMDTLQYFIIALRAKYWITCVNIERGLNFKRKDTVYLNTWHGTPLKLVGNAVSGRKDFNFSSIDIFCYAGEFEKEIYIRDFKVNEFSLLLSGLPRNDELYQVSRAKKDHYRKLLNIPAEKKVILYAPTWRDSIDKGKSYSISPPINITDWQNELEDC